MFSLNCKGKLLFIERPVIMGVVNLTQDSFYPESRAANVEAARIKCRQMITEGAAIIDLGAQSTRPGSQRLSPEEELRRLLPVLEMLQKDFPDIPLSVDTYHSKVARESVQAGASLINDISGGEMDKEMITTVASLNVPYICMHMKGTPETMQLQTAYDDLIGEVLDFFIRKTEECQLAGIRDLIIDPGFGFGKTYAQNFLLLKNLNLFQMFKKPIMAGLSRKSSIYKTLHIPVEDSLNGTTVLHTLALLNGASLLRVHDVKEAREVVTLIDAYLKS